MPPRRTSWLPARPATCSPPGSAASRPCGAASRCTPRGEISRAVLEVTTPVAGTGPFVGSAATYDGLARHATAMGLPSPWPDIDGLALRLPVDGQRCGPAIRATGTGQWTRHVLVPHRSGAPVPMTTLFPFETDAGRPGARGLPGGRPPLRPAGLRGLRSVAAARPADPPRAPPRRGPARAALRPRPQRPTRAGRRPGTLVALRDPAYVAAPAHLMTSRPTLPEEPGVRIEASGPQPVDDTWEQYTRPAAWPEWAPQIHAVRGVSGSIEAGDRGSCAARSPSASPSPSSPSTRARTGGRSRSASGRSPWCSTTGSTARRGTRPGRGRDRLGGRPRAPAARADLRSAGPHRPAPAGGAERARRPRPSSATCSAVSSSRAAPTDDRVPPRRLVHGGPARRGTARDVRGDDRGVPRPPEGRRQRPVDPRPEWGFPGLVARRPLVRGRGPLAPGVRRRRGRPRRPRVDLGRAPSRSWRSRSSASTRSTYRRTSAPGAEGRLTRESLDVRRLAEVLEAVALDAHQPHPGGDGRVPVAVDDPVELVLVDAGEVVGRRPRDLAVVAREQRRGPRSAPRRPGRWCGRSRCRRCRSAGRSAPATAPTPAAPRERPATWWSWTRARCQSSHPTGLPVPPGRWCRRLLVEPVGKVGVQLGDALEAVGEQGADVHPPTVRRPRLPTRAPGTDGGRGGRGGP